MSERRPSSDGTKLSPQTLVIASLASLTAAIVTSTFWQRGTPITAAITPVIVAVASELYSRPARRITEYRSRRFTQQHVPQRERVPTGAPPRRPDAVRPPEDAELGPMRIYRTEQRSSPIRRVHIRAALVTAAIAFVIALAVLTLPELIFGGSVAARSRTTFFGGGTSHHQTHKSTPSNTQTAPTQTAPSTTAPTQTAPTTTTPPAQTAPQTTAPSQTPAPSGATGTTGPSG